MRKIDFDWNGGNVTFWNLDRIDEGREISSQLDELEEDLAQVEFPHGIVLDVGWYPEFSADGRFGVVVVQAGDWESPLWQRETGNVTELRERIQGVIRAATEAR